VTARPPRLRCPRGHFLSRTGTCRCTHTRPYATLADLYNQRADVHQLRTMTTICLTGSYL